MVHSLKEAETRETLRRCHANQQREALLPAAWTKPPANSYNVFLLFNLEAAWDEGHCILALGPVGGPLQTYSYYRHSSQLEAPGIMADLREPMTFAELQERSGWIVHGQPGNWWNEHVNCAIALWCDEATFRAVQACAEDRRAHTGTYNLITYNCLTFCDEALAAGAASTCSRKAAANCTPSSPRTPLGTWTGWRAPIPSRRGSTGSPSASRRQTACAPSRTSQARTSRWNKREVAPRARSWSTSCMMGGALRRRRCLPSARRASRLAWEKRFSLSGLLRFSAAFRQRCSEEGMP